MKAKVIASTLLVGLLCSCAPEYQKESTAPTPEPPREFRAAWIATVANIDWPSGRDLTAGQQQEELIGLLDLAVELKLNAVILQMRPACDALYPSELEPWSEYLTGAMGKPPEPFYDPLAFAVKEAHRRNLELHAWFNPYRARHLSAKSPASANHISRTRPELVRTYGQYLWLDPAEPAVQAHSRNVILDVVRRYDVDGVHMDDYFYPYQVRDDAGKLLDFPDDDTWSRYQASGGKLARADWRRSNVDEFIRSAYEAVKAEKPWVKFGLSPFGIWRPGHPPQVEGLDAYNSLYADAKKWFENGWVDYFTPQLYWRIEPARQSFPALLQWWSEQNLKGRHLWPGMNTTGAARWGADEIVNQVAITRDHSDVTGHVHWNISSLRKNSGGIADELKTAAYTDAALVPASPWLQETPPSKPSLTVRRNNDELEVTWSAAAGGKVGQWLFQTQTAGQWSTEILPVTVTAQTLAAGSSPDLIAVSAVDRYGNKGPAAVRGK